MKLLHAISTVDPAGGGPIEGIKQLSRVMRRLGHEVDVLSMDRPDALFLGHVGTRVHALGPAVGKYALSPRTIPWLREHGREYDSVIVNGLWQFNGLATLLSRKYLGGPYLVYPHGMLDPWFKHTYPLKHLKKWLYWPWADYRLLKHAKAVLFTSQQELEDAARSFWLYRCNGRVVNYGTPGPDDAAERHLAAFSDAVPALRGTRFLLFLGRLHPKKGCDLLIEAFGRVANLDPAMQLAVVGPDQVGIRRDLERRARGAGVFNRIHFIQMLSGDAKWGALRAADAFALTSHQENFGIAVAEATACGTPVLISDKVNIYREIVRDSAGFAEPDTAEGAERLLRRWLELPQEERAVMRIRARQSFERRFNIEAAAESLIAAILE